MSTKPDRLALMMAVDHCEDDGLHPDQVAFLRSWVFEKCQPKVKDVVEMAMQLREKMGGNSLKGVLNTGSSSWDSYLRTVVDADNQFSPIVAKLLEMTPERRQMVASRVAEKAAELEISADLLLIDDPIAKTTEESGRQFNWAYWSDAANATPLAALREMQRRMREGPIGQPWPPRGSPSRPIMAIYTVTGETMEVLAYSSGERGLESVECRTASGELRRFEGDQLSQMRFSP